MKKRIFHKSLSLLIVVLCLLNFTACDTTPSSPEKPLDGKLISVIGDSISTFEGISNNTNINSTLGSNASYYKRGVYRFDSDDTWWQQAAETVGAEILVNNSWSGSCTYFNTRGEGSQGYLDRCVNLHDNRGREPDIIAVFMGTNDFSNAGKVYGSLDSIDYENLVADDGSYEEPTSFVEAYALMLARMKHRYPNAEIYCFNILQRATFVNDLVTIPNFNNLIETIAKKSGAYVVDLYNETGITGEPLPYSTYMADGKLHPSAYGMDAITGCFVSSLYQNSRFMPKKFETCNITYDLTDVVVCQGTTKLVPKGSALEMNFTVDEGMHVKVTVTMNGKDVTDKYFKDDALSIPKVTGDITIKARATRQ